MERMALKEKKIRKLVACIRQLILSSEIFLIDHWGKKKKKQDPKESQLVKTQWGAEYTQSLKCLFADWKGKPVTIRWRAQTTP